MIVAHQHRLAARRRLGGTGAARSPSAHARANLALAVALVASTAAAVVH